MNLSPHQLWTARAAWSVVALVVTLIAFTVRAGL